MTFKVDGANGLIFPDSSTQAVAGKVLQIVSARNTTATTTSSTTFVTTNFSVSITPKFATSKILVICAGGCFRASSSYNQAFLTLYRNNTTNLGDTTSGMCRGDVGAAASQCDFPVSMSYYDSPATTSATTYTVYVHTDSSTTTFGLDSSPTTLTAMEIAA